MSMFLTPDGRPFFGGSYFPPRDRQGVSGFLTDYHRRRQSLGNRKDVNREIGQRLDRAREVATQSHQRRAQAGVVTYLGGPKDCGLLTQQFDQENADLASILTILRRPNFPQPADLYFLLDQHRRGAPSKDPTDPLNMVLLTLDRMARGGIRDQLAGGYHRYSTDRFWLVPHFEKMLYDNAQLASIHLLAFELTRTLAGATRRNRPSLSSNTP